MKIKKILLIIILFFIYFLFNSFSYSRTISQDLEQNIFRLRIIANSNSKEDQELKLAIRNNILELLNKENFTSKEETLIYLKSNKSKLENIIQSTITTYGKNYNFSYEISNSFYPQKSYQNIFLPAGNYDGLQIKLGNASGQNWWCILFPKLCLIDSQTYENDITIDTSQKQNLSSESIDIIKKNNVQYKFKFKIIDFINNL